MLALDEQSKEVIAAAGALTDETLDLVSTDVDGAYEDQKAIEAELRRIQSLLKSQAHHVSLYQGVIDNLVSSLKELGDVSNWAQMLETISKDVSDLCERSRGAAQGPGL